MGENMGKTLLFVLKNNDQVEIERMAEDEITLEILSRPSINAHGDLKAHFTQEDLNSFILALSAILNEKIDGTIREGINPRDNL